MNKGVRFTSALVGKNETLRFLIGLLSEGDASPSNLVPLLNSLALLDVVKLLSLLLKVLSISSCFVPDALVALVAPFTTIEDFRGLIFLAGSSIISITLGMSSSSYSSSSLDDMEMSRPGSRLTLLMRISKKPQIESQYS